MAWLRLYDEVADDPKVQQLPPILFRAWVNCLCITKRYGGVLPEMKDVAFILHVTESRAHSIVNDLIKARLFEDSDGKIRPHNWCNRQFQSDVSTDRVKRFRNAHRNENETPPDTDTEAETETETEQKKPYGPFATVRLSDAEYSKLVLQFGEEGAMRRVQILDEYIASKGKRYKSHYATILAWERKNGIGMVRGRIPL